MIGPAPIAAALLAASLLTPFGGKAHRKTEEGNRHFAAEDWERALAAYTEAQVAAPEAPELHYDIGNVLYRQQEWEAAAEAFERALAAGPAELQPQAAYNLGNVRFQQQAYDKAVEAYRRALEAVPGDPDAKRNLELSLRALREQRQQQSPDRQRGSGEREPPSDGPPQPGAEGGPRPSPPPPGGAGSMSPDQAARLLDAAEQAERAGLRDEARRLAGRGVPSREKDW